MMKSILSDLRIAWYKHAINKLIIINLGVFLCMKILYLFPGYHRILRGLSISTGLWHDLTHPWVWLTHMFLHEGLFHIIFNMLYLYWFGKILGDFLGDDRIWPFYILSGLGGAVFYVFVGGWMPNVGVASFALGASAAVMGILWAVAVLTPDYTLHLLFIGAVKIKWIALVLFVIDLISVTGVNNTGGHLGHIGGAMTGAGLMYLLKNGRDYLTPFNRMIQKFGGWFIYDRNREPVSPLKVVHRKKSHHVSDNGIDFEERLNEILDKIKLHGYDALTEEEKSFLQQASEKD